MIAATVQDILNLQKSSMYIEIRGYPVKWITITGGLGNKFWKLLIQAQGTSLGSQLLILILNS